MSKPILAIDLDGTINSFTSGFTSPTDLPDAPVPGAQAFCAKALETFEVMVVGPRTGDPAGVDAIRAWLQKHNFPEEIFIIEDGVYPPAFLTLSARAQTFTGTFPEEPKKMLAFRPWYVKGSKVGQASATWTALKKLYDEQMEIAAEGYAPMPGMDWLEGIAKILKETRNGE